MVHRPFELHGIHLRDYLHSHQKTCPEQARPYVLAATILASSMAFIDYTVIGIAVPSLQAEFAATIADLQWVVNSYALALGALVLVGGGLGDRVRRRRVFILGIVIFTLASIMAALSPNVTFLIVARALQGVGAALLVPQSLASISANFPKEVRGKAIGTWAAASAATTAIGPPVGGFLIDLLSWRAVFWINVPLAVVSIWLILRYVEESRDESEEGPIDWLGAAVAVLAFGALTYGLTIISDTAVSSGTVIAWMAAGIIGVGAFLAVERRARNPVMPLDLFKSRVFTGVNITTVFLYGALAGILFLVPFDLLARRGLTATQAGLIMLPFGLIIGFASRYTGALADKYGPRPFLVGGPLLVAVGCAGFSLTDENVWIAALIPIVIMSFGMAIVVSPLTTAVMNAAPDNRAGAASGISNAASRLSGVLAVAIFGATAGLVFSWAAPADAVFGLVPPVGDPARPAIESAFASAYSVSMLFAAIWCVIAAAVAWVSLGSPDTAKPEAPAS